MLFLNDIESEEEQINVFKSLASKYKGDPINFFYTDKNILDTIDGIKEPDSFPIVHIIKGKRKRYTTLNQPVTEENLSH